MKMIIILCTFPNKMSTVLHVTENLLNKKIAACISMIHGVRSFYYWNNELKNSAEIQLLIKTKNTLKKQVFNIIKYSHPYTTPEIIVLPVIDGEINYLSWIQSTLKISDKNHNIHSNPIKTK